MRATWRFCAYFAMFFILPIVTAIACQSEFHNYLLAWRPDGKVLAVQGQDVTFFDTNLQSPTAIFHDQIFTHSQSLMWNPAGDKLILISNPGIFLWQQNTGKLEPILANEQNVTDIAWSPDGNAIAFNGNFSIHIADTQSFQITNSLKDINNPNEGIQSIVWSPDGTLIAGGTGSGKVQIWNVNNKSLLRTLITSLKAVYSVAWDSNNAHTIAVGGYDSNKVYLWDVLSGSLVTTIDSGQSDAITQIAWSPNGRFVAVAALSGVKILNASNYQQAQAFDYRDGDLTSMAWSPDSSQIAIVGNRDSVTLWDVSSGKLLAQHDMTQ